MLDKLNKIFEIIERNHINFYFNHSKEEFEEFKREALSKFKLEDDYDVLYVSNYLIKKMMNENDSHTIIRYFDDKENHKFGVRFRIINNKVYIFDCSNSINEYKYSEVLELNSIDINKIVDEMRDRCCYQTDGFKEANVERFLCDIPSLRGLPSIDNNTRDFTLKINVNNQIKHIVIPREGILFRNYKHEEYNGVMRIIYSLCRESQPNQMIDFVEDIKKVENIDYYIVDLRGNTGGNNKIIDPLIEFLTDKKVIVLIDKFVFSAGKWACLKLKKIGAKFIGTDIGTPINCFGNNPGVDFDKFYVQASEYYFCADEHFKNPSTKDELEEIRNNEIMKPRYFHPDIYVEESIEALRNNIDIYLEKAFEYIDNIKET